MPQLLAITTGLINQRHVCLSVAAQPVPVHGQDLPRPDRKWPGLWRPWYPTATSIKNDCGAQLPEAWWRFQFIANDELRAGRGKISCLQCNTQIPIDMLPQEDDCGRAGWNSDRLICPHGHPLLVFESVHLSVRPREDSTPE